MSDVSECMTLREVAEQRLGAGGRWREVLLSPGHRYRAGQVLTITPPEVVDALDAVRAECRPVATGRKVRVVDAIPESTGVMLEDGTEELVYQVEELETGSLLRVGTGWLSERDPYGPTDGWWTAVQQVWDQGPPKGSGGGAT